MRIIIYKRPDGGLTEIIPADSSLTIEEIAQKDVPTGLAYKIIEDTDVPTDLTFRDAWDIDEAELTDGVGSTEGVTEQI